MLTAVEPIRVSADPQATAAKQDETYTGTVTSVDLKERVLVVKGLVRSKTPNFLEEFFNPETSLSYNVKQTFDK